MGHGGRQSASGGKKFQHIFLCAGLSSNEGLLPKKCIVDELPFGDATNSRPVLHISELRSPC